MRKYRPWTAEEIAILENFYPRGGVAACKKRLDRSSEAIAVRAKRSGIAVGAVPGMMNITEIARLANVRIASVREYFERRRIGKRIGKYKLIPEKIAFKYIEDHCAMIEKQKLLSAGYLRTSQVVAMLKIGRSTATKWAAGRGWLAQRFGVPRTVRSVRNAIFWNPHDVERARIQLERERRAAREMKPIKTVAPKIYRRRNVPTIKTLVRGRIVRFVDSKEEV